MDSNSSSLSLIERSENHGSFASLISAFVFEKPSPQRILQKLDDDGQSTPTEIQKGFTLWHLNNLDDRDCEDLENAWEEGGQLEISVDLAGVYGQEEVNYYFSLKLEDQEIFSEYGFHFEIFSQPSKFWALTRGRK
ncbi:hypothetical protein NPIL_278321 [Nephila pilipes]|uniref:Uncharacterized protein n=1 Tax=Nephila pilipes TaxID=299642 RepID=A0A8X6KGU4_NEPPI|nr:hypothetical protein NPIL_278321 [Nephila pilipes]